jgi:peptide/nickel transport system substrate-binding protein
VRISSSTRTWSAGSVLSLVALVLLSACAAPTGLPAPAGGGAAPSDPTRPRSVTIAVKAEIPDVSAKVGGGDTFSGEFNFLSASPLVVHDGRGVVHPLLAETQPSRDDGSWVVNADGTMATTWRIRPNAKWHDDRPITPEDFAFTLRVYQSPDLPVTSREPERFMDRIERLDDRSFVIHWNRTYPWANELIARQLDPLLARHVMESAFDTMEPATFLRQEFWLRKSWIGNGPYRVTQVEPGTRVVFRAFDDYFLGRPRLDEVIFQIIEDTNTVLANLLGGAADVSVGVTLGQIAGATVRDRWRDTGDGEVVITPVRFRFYEFQHDPMHNRTPAVLDARVRRAFAHAIDRKSLAEVVSAGTSSVAHIYLAPGHALYERAISGGAPQYDHDPTRALGLLTEAGWTRRGDPLVNAGGEPISIEIRTTGGTDNETEASIIIADLGRIGIAASLNVMSEAVQENDEYRSTFPGMNATARSIRSPETMGIWTTAQCPNPRQNYRGANRGCWRNEAFDGFFQVASTSLNASERADATASALRILAQEVGVLGLSYNSENIAVRRGLVGPGPRSSEQVGNTWNIQDWHWAS